MQLTGTTIRVACNQARTSDFVNAIGNQAPVIPKTGSVQIPCAIFTDDPTVSANLLTDLGNIVTANLVIRNGGAAGAVLFEQVIPAANFNPALTFAQWTAGTAAHFTFSLSPTDTNLTATTLWMAIGVSTTNAGDIPLVFSGRAQLKDYGLFNAAAPTAPDYTSWSKAEADGRYPLLGSVPALDDPRLVNAYENYAQMVAAAVDSLIAGNAPSAATQNFFSTYDGVNKIFTRNPTCITPFPSFVSCWNSANADGTGGNRGCVTMVTPTQGVTNNHFAQPYAAGVVHYFLGTDGNNYPLTVASSRQVGTSDAQLVTFATAAPAVVGCAGIFAPGVPARILPPGTPLLTTNQYKQALVSEVSLASASADTEFGIQQAQVANRIPWSQGVPAAVGDSDSPSFVDYEGQLVLVTTDHASNGGPAYSELAPAIQALLPVGSALQIVSPNALGTAATRDVAGSAPGPVVALNSANQIDAQFLPANEQGASQPYLIPAQTGSATLPAGTQAATFGNLQGPLTVYLPNASGYAQGATIVFSDPSQFTTGNPVTIQPAAGTNNLVVDLQGMDYANGGLGVKIFTDEEDPAGTRFTFESDGRSAWVQVPIPQPPLPITFPFTGIPYSPSPGGTPRQATGADVTSLLAGATCNVYVDSTIGNDRYNGTSLASPLKTLTAAQAAAVRVGTGATVGLARGSYWRQALDLSAVTAASVLAYGTGTAPNIDGADEFTAWTLASGRTNVYQTTVTHNATATNRITAYEDGALLVRVADQATCDSTPGSFVDAKGSDGSPLTFFIHPVAGGNPATNGHRYEITTRMYCLVGGAGFSAAGVQTQRQIANDGSTVAGSTGVSLTQILAVNGTKHNLIVGSGTLTDCIAALADAPTSYEPGNTAFVAYLDDGTGQSVAFTRCACILQPAGVNDFYSHGNVHPLASVVLVQTWSLGSYYCSPANTITGSLYRGSLALPTDNGTWSGVLCDLPAQSGVSNVGEYGAFSATDCAINIAERGAGNSQEVLRPSGPASFAHCAFNMLAAPYPADTSLMANTAGTASIASDHCVYFGGLNHIVLAAGVTYTGNYNVFYTQFFSSQIRNTTADGTSQTLLTAWQTATGQDAHSVYLAAADQVAGGANAFWLGWKNAASGTDVTTVGPASGDWRINPAAKVYAANGTAYVGTFPDGTAITLAGPQNHWDWNARATAAGAPLAWPVVPATLADVQAYTANPAAWLF